MFAASENWCTISAIRRSTSLQNITSRSRTLQKFHRKSTICIRICVSFFGFCTLTPKGKMISLKCAIWQHSNGRAERPTVRSALKQGRNAPSFAARKQHQAASSAAPVQHPASAGPALAAPAQSAHIHAREQLKPKIAIFRNSFSLFVRKGCS